MSRKKTTQNNSTRKIKRDRDPIPWRYCLLMLVCGMFLVGGFFVAARQHFSSIEYSIKNSRLRKQIDDLEADKRRFQLAKEIALTPSEIKKAAKKIGLTEMTAANIEAYRPDTGQVELPKVEKISEAKPKPIAADKPKNAQPEEKKTKKIEKKKSEEKSDKEKAPAKSAK